MHLLLLCDKRHVDPLYFLSFLEPVITLLRREHYLHFTAK